MLKVIAGFSTLRILRGYFAIIEMKAWNLLMMGACCLCLFSFFLLTTKWGRSLVWRVKLTKERTHSANTNMVASGQKIDLIDRFSAFLKVQVIISSIWLLEQIASGVLVETEFLSLKKNAPTILILKMTQRLTEWLMVSATLPPS